MSQLFDEIQAIFPRFVEPVEKERDRAELKAELLREIAVEAHVELARGERPRLRVVS